MIYRETNKIDMEVFKRDIENLQLQELQRFPDPYTGFVTLFKSVVDRHAPIKRKKVRGNDKPFMNSELRNAIKQKSKIRNKYNNFRSRQNYLEWQKKSINAKNLQIRQKKTILNISSLRVL